MCMRVDDCFGHSGSFEMLRPGLLPALRRIGSASAGGCNPLVGFRMNLSYFGQGGNRL